MELKVVDTGNVLAIEADFRVPGLPPQRLLFRRWEAGTEPKEREVYTDPKTGHRYYAELTPLHEEGEETDYATAQAPDPWHDMLFSDCLTSPED